MDKAVQIIQLPLWLYNDLKVLAAAEQADNLVDVIAKLVAQAREQHSQPVLSPTPAFQRILERATNLGVTDLAEQHDHYLYGVEKT